MPCPAIDPPWKNNWRRWEARSHRFVGRFSRDAREHVEGDEVAPKYRSPDGDTWAGRGATPRWLVAAIKEGKKLEIFNR